MTARADQLRPPLARRLDQLPLRQRREWLVKGLIERASAALLIAEEGGGKSALAVAMVEAVVAGGPFLGRSTTPGPVLWFAAEKSFETERRLRATLPPELLCRVAIAGRCDLAEGGTVERLMDDCLSAFQGQPALIVIDTFGALLPGDENSTRDVKALTDRFDDLRAKTGAAMLVLHHRKRGEERARGAQGLSAWVDVVLGVKKSKSGLAIETVKANALPTNGPPIPFMLKPIPLDPSDLDAGECVVAVPVQTVARAESAPRPLPPNEQTALSELVTLTRGSERVPLSEWRQACFNAWSKPSEGTARQAWSSLQRSETSRLLKDGLILIEGEFVRLVRVSEVVRTPSEFTPASVRTSALPLKGEPGSSDILTKRRA